MFMPKAHSQGEVADLGRQRSQPAATARGGVPHKNPLHPPTKTTASQKESGTPTRAPKAPLQNHAAPPHSSKHLAGGGGAPDGRVRRPSRRLRRAPGVAGASQEA